jgi:hypothetical protein
MTEHEEIPLNFEDMKIAYTSLWYDGPAAGHAWYMGKYCFFMVNDQYTKDGKYVCEYRLYEITGDTLLAELANRKMCEDLFGFESTEFIAVPKVRKELSVIYPNALKKENAGIDFLDENDKEIAAYITANNRYYGKFNTILDVCSDFEGIDTHPDLIYLGIVYGDS